MAELTTGQPAPDFVLPIAGGGTMGLATLRGKTVVLFFYPKDDTTSCTAEAIDFSALRGEFDQVGAVVVGISPDSIRKHDRFKAKYGLAVELVSDEERHALEAYDVWQEKTLYGRKYMGVERTTVLIDRQGLIARIWRKVKVSGHAQEVLQAARAIA